MASDQRFARTVHAVAEAVQTFAAGTFDFAESIKQIWGPQAESDATEASAPLPIDGMEGVQVLDDLRERTPVSQEGQQHAIESQSPPASVLMHHGQSEPQQQQIDQAELADPHSVLDFDAPGESSQQPGRICYECFGRWQRRWRSESAIPPCEPVPGRKTCKYCISIHTTCIMTPLSKTGVMMRCKMDLDLAAQNGDASIERERFLNAFFEASDLLEMPLSPSITEIRQQQMRLKRAQQDIEEQQPISKRQRTYQSRHEPKLERREQDDQQVAEDEVSSRSSARSDEEDEAEVVPNELSANSPEQSPHQPNQVTVDRKTESGAVIESEEEYEESMSSSEEQSSEAEMEDGTSESSSEEDEEIVEVLAVKPSSPEQDKDTSEETIRQEAADNDSYSSSSEYGSSEEESEQPSPTLVTKFSAQLAQTRSPKPAWVKQSRETIQHEEEEDDQSYSSTSEVGSDEESDGEESEEEPTPKNAAHPVKTQATTQSSHDKPEVNPQEGIESEEDDSNSYLSASEDESSGEESSGEDTSEQESEEGSEEQPATKNPPGKYEARPIELVQPKHEVRKEVKETVVETIEKDVESSSGASSYDTSSDSREEI